MEDRQQTVCVINVDRRGGRFNTRLIAGHRPGAILIELDHRLVSVHSRMRSLDVFQLLLMLIVNAASLVVTPR